MEVGLCSEVILGLMMRDIRDVEVVDIYESYEVGSIVDKFNRVDGVGEGWRSLAHVQKLAGSIVVEEDSGYSGDGEGGLL